MSDTDSPILSRRFSRALKYAHKLHRNQIRKGADTPYIGHLLAVASLVLEAGGTEDEAIAALLHDGPEDAGGQAVLDKIAWKFGRNVAVIVEHCSDTLVEDRADKEDWWLRRDAYQGKLASGPESALLVSLADKVHNAEATLRDFGHEGDAVFERFQTGRDGTLWNYTRLLMIYRNRESPRLKPLVDRLQHALEALAQPEGLGRFKETPRTRPPGHRSQPPGSG